MSNNEVPRNIYVLERPNHETSHNIRLKRQLSDINYRSALPLFYLRTFVYTLGSVNINDLCIHPGLEFPSKFKCPGFEK